MAEYVGALDQGTTSTRFIVFNKQGRIVSSAQEEHSQIFPASACVEHDPEEIWKRTCEVITAALKSAGECCSHAQSGLVEALQISSDRRLFFDLQV